MLAKLPTLDKLIITIDTDGTITAKDAFEEAAAILINQYTALAGQTRVEAVPANKAIAANYGADENEEPSELLSFYRRFKLKRPHYQCLNQQRYPYLKGFV